MYEQATITIPTTLLPLPSRRGSVTLVLPSGMSVAKTGSLASKLPSAASILPPPPLHRSSSSHDGSVATTKPSSPVSPNDQQAAHHHPNEATSAESGISDTSQPGSSGRKYERRTKRFIWPDELHRLFVAAVFDVGLKNASPKALLTLMGTPACTNGLTTE
ncbi:hypothetical protein AaE_003698, partial [Aphanomyces astaci]